MQRHKTSDMHSKEGHRNGSVCTIGGGSIYAGTVSLVFLDLQLTLKLLDARLVFEIDWLEVMKARIVEALVLAQSQSQVANIQTRICVKVTKSFRRILDTQWSESQWSLQIGHPFVSINFKAVNNHSTTIQQLFNKFRNKCPTINQFVNNCSTFIHHE
eukprot:2162241-Amphidinium_carterae.1